MRRKLYTPVKIGAFEPQSRLAIDRGRPDRLRSHISGRLNDLMEQHHLGGGLLICEADLFSDAVLLPWRAAQSRTPNAGWLPLLPAARRARQTVLVRLDAGLPTALRDRLAGVSDFTDHDIQQIIVAYVDAAHRARSIGADGIELDATAGTLADLFLLNCTNSRRDRYGGSPERRMTFLQELVDALAKAIGAHCLGIRLSPFRDDGVCLRSAIFEDILPLLNEQEIAYVHLVDPTPFRRRGGAPRPASPAADALRSAFPGFLVSSCEPSIAHACDLIDTRWADAVCVPGSDALAELTSAQNLDGGGGACALRSIS